MGEDDTRLNRAFDGVECLWLAELELDGVASPVRRRKGVRPEEVEDGVPHCREGPGSEKRTRFFVRLGV